MTIRPTIQIVTALVFALAVLPSCKEPATEKAPATTAPPAAGAPAVAPAQPSTEVPPASQAAAPAASPSAAPAPPPSTAPVPSPVAGVPVAPSIPPPTPAVAPAKPVDTTPPTAPKGLAARPGATPTEIELTWQPATDDVAVAGYEVSSGGKVVARGTAPAARVGGVPPSHPTCFTVSAVDASGNHSAPSPQACATLPDVTAPTTPADVVAEALPEQVKLRWSPATDDVGVAGYEVLRGEATVAKTPESSATESDLKPAVAHCYVVRAYDAAGNRSAPSAAACATPPDVTPPSAPRALQATASAETEVVLTWGAATDDVGVVGYEVQRGDAVATRATGTRSGDAGLRAGTTYCYRVRAFDAAGNKGQPTPDTCVTTLDLSPPKGPPTVTAAEESPGQVRIRWAAATDNVGVVRYEVRREGKLAGVTQGLDTTEGGLADGRFHCYTVTAFDRAGNASPPTTPACATIPDRTPPSVPGGVRSVGNSGTQIHVAWTPSTDNVKVLEYEVLRDGVVVTRAPAALAMVTGLAPETSSCYTVRAVDVAGNRSAASAETCAMTAAPGSIAAPTNLQAKAGGAGEILLTWEPSPEKEVVYVVFLDGDAKGLAGVKKRTGERRIGTTARPSMKLTGAFTAEKNCYRVAAQTQDVRVSPQTLPACAMAAR